MEKIKNKKENVPQNQKVKDSNKKHHHRRISIDKMNSRFLNFIEKEKNQKNINKIKETKIKDINITNINEAKKSEFNYYKKSSLKKSSSNISIPEIDKNYIKNKINYVDKSDKKKDSIKYQVVDYNIIINNNKTNVYYNEKSINNNVISIPEKKEKIKLNDSLKNNYIKNDSQMIKYNNDKKEDLFEELTFKKKNKIKNDNDSIINSFHQKEEEININQNFINKEIKIKNSEINEKSSIISEYENEKKDLVKKEYKKSLIEQESEESEKRITSKQSFKIKLKTYLTQYANIKLIYETYPGGFNYLQNILLYLDISCPEEEFNFILAQKNLYKSQNAKELCRKGVPLPYLKKFLSKLLKLENCVENYTFKYSMIIKELDPEYMGDYVPYYYGKTKIKLKEILFTHYLNEDGIKELKVIMWLISDLVPKLEYSPFLVKICSIFLLFFDKEETFESMRTLIEMNYDPSDIYKLRWHFRYSFNENKKLIDSIKIFLENQSENIKELFNIFREKGLEPLMLINEFVESLFLDFLNFYGILRFICIFLYEGVKSLYRISFGILNYLYENNLEEIKECKKDLLNKLKNIIFNTFDYNKIFEECFELKLSRFNNGYIKDNYGEDIEELEIPFECASRYYNNNNNSENDSDEENENEKDKEISKEQINTKEKSYISNFYLPSIEPKSNILTSKYIFKLWPKLPKSLRNSNLATIYSLSRKKINMRSILELSSKYPQDFRILILIETEQKELFGIILPQMLKDTGEEQYIKLDKCYLINFNPKINIYRDTNKIKWEKMLCCNKKGLWFCKKEVGDLIYINGTLTAGKTCKDNNYFGQGCLTKKENFLIKDFEIIVFAKNDI